MSVPKWEDTLPVDDVSKGSSVPKFEDTSPVGTPLFEETSPIESSTAESPDTAPGFLRTARDVGAAIEKGFANTVTTTGQLMSMSGRGLGIEGLQRAGDATRDYGQELEDWWSGTMAQENREPRSFGRKALFSTAESAPSMIGAFIPAAGATMGLRALGMASKATKVGKLAGAGAYLVSKAPTIAGAIAEGTQAGAQNAAQTRREIEQMPDERIAQHPRFQEELAKTSADLPPQERFKQARESLTQSVENEIMLKTATWTGGVSLLSGAGAIGVMLEAPAKKFLTNVFKGFTREMLQELFQSGGEYVIQEQAAQGAYDAERAPTLAGTGEAATLGAIAGAILGAGGGAMKGAEVRSYLSKFKAAGIPQDIADALATSVDPKQAERRWAVGISVKMTPYEAMRYATAETIEDGTRMMKNHFQSMDDLARQIVYSQGIQSGLAEDQALAAATAKDPVKELNRLTGIKAEQVSQEMARIRAEAIHAEMNPEEGVQPQVRQTPILEPITEANRRRGTPRTTARDVAIPGEGESVPIASQQGQDMVRMLDSNESLVNPNDSDNLELLVQEAMKPAPDAPQGRSRFLAQRLVSAASSETRRMLLIKRLQEQNPNMLFWSPEQRRQRMAGNQAVTESQESILNESNTSINPEDLQEPSVPVLREYFNLGKRAASEKEAQAEAKMLAVNKPEWARAFLNGYYSAHPELVVKPNTAGKPIPESVAAIAEAAGLNIAVPAGQPPAQGPVAAATAPIAAPQAEAATGQTVAQLEGSETLTPEERAKRADFDVWLSKQEDVAKLRQLREDNLSDGNQWAAEAIAVRLEKLGKLKRAGQPKEAQNAAQAGKKQEGARVEPAGTPSGTAVPEDQAQVRGAEGEPAGVGNRPSGAARLREIQQQRAATATPLTASPLDDQAMEKAIAAHLQRGGMDAKRAANQAAQGVRMAQAWREAGATQEEASRAGIVYGIGMTDQYDSMLGQFQKNGEIRLREAIRDAQPIDEQEAAAFGVTVPADRYELKDGTWEPISAELGERQIGVDGLKVAVSTARRMRTLESQLDTFRRQREKAQGSRFSPMEIEARRKLKKDVEAMYAYKTDDTFAGRKAWLTQDGRWINVDDHAEIVPFYENGPDVGVEEMNDAGYVRVAWEGGMTKLLHAEYSPDRLTSAQRSALEYAAFDHGGEVAYDPGYGRSRFSPNENDVVKAVKDYADARAAFVAGKGGKAVYGSTAPDGETQAFVGVHMKDTHGSFNFSPKFKKDNAIRWRVSNGNKVMMWGKPTKVQRDAIREYMARVHGWKRVAGDTVETQTLTDDDLDQIASGLADILFEEDITDAEADSTTFDIYVNANRRWYRGVPYSVIKERSVAALRKYDETFRSRLSPVEMPADPILRNWFKVGRGMKDEQAAKTKAGTQRKKHPDWAQALMDGFYSRNSALRPATAPAAAPVAQGTEAPPTAQAAPAANPYTKRIEEISKNFTKDVNLIARAIDELLSGSRSKADKLTAQISTGLEGMGPAEVSEEAAPAKGTVDFPDEAPIAQEKRFTLSNPSGPKAKERWWIDLKNRILDLSKAIPAFQGGKKSLALRVAYHIQKLWTESQRKSIRTVNDYFGGSGGWGLFLARDGNFDNAKAVNVFEFNPDRVLKIKFLYEKGDQFHDLYVTSGLRDMFNAIETEILRLDPKSKSSMSAMSARLDALKDKNPGKVDSDTWRGMVQFLVDYGVASFATRREGGMEQAPQQAIKILDEQANNLRQAVKELRNRGVTVSIRQADSYSLALAGGKDVLSVFDPPYYNTTGYGPDGTKGDRVGIDLYRKTAAMIEQVAAANNNLIYTDEVWWGEDKLADPEKEKAERDKQDAERPEAMELLKRVQNLFPHFDIWHEPVGRGRWETIGMRNAMETAEQKSQASRFSPAEKSASLSKLRNAAAMGNMQLTRATRAKLAQNKAVRVDISGRREVRDVMNSRDTEYRQNVSEGLVKMPISIAEAVKGYEYDDFELEQLSLYGSFYSPTGFKNVAPPVKKAYRPAVVMYDGTVVYGGMIHAHAVALHNVKHGTDYGADDVEATGGVAPDGNFYAASFIGDVDTADIRKIERDIRRYGKARFSPAERETAPTFYSQLRRVLEQKMPNRSTVQQVRGMIDPQKGSGVKADELKWSGLQEFLDSKKPLDMVTKDEVLAAAREVELKEVVLGEINLPKGKYFIEAVRNGRMQREELTENQAVERMRISGSAVIVVRDDGRESTFTADDFTGDTKFSQYTEPGYGEGSYREYVITMPQASRPSFEKWLLDNYSISSENLTDSQRRLRETEYGNRVEADRDFRSSHFQDIPGYLYHFRTNVRTVNGKKILFVEEIQSDRAQNARKLRDKEVLKVAKLIADKRGSLPSNQPTDADIAEANKRVAKDFGFRTAWPESEIAKFTVQDQGTGDGVNGDWAVLDGQGNLIASPPKYLNKTAEDALRLIQKSAREGTLNAMGKIPQMPFADTSSGWAKQAMRRVIRLAAEQGADMVAWTPGRMQIDRYNEAMRQNVDRIEVKPGGRDASGPWLATEPGTGRTERIAEKDRADYLRGNGWTVKTVSSGVEIVASKNGSEVFRAAVPLEGVTKIHGHDARLQDVIGKNLADKVRAAPNQRHEFTGPDLAIGGEGMISYYDRMLVNIANDIGKKWGVKVEMRDMGGDKRSERDVLDRMMDEEPPREVADADEYLQSLARVRGAMGEGNTFAEAIASEREYGDSDNANSIEDAVIEKMKSSAQPDPSTLDPSVPRDPRYLRSRMEGQRAVFDHFEVGRRLPNSGGVSINGVHANGEKVRVSTIGIPLGGENMGDAIPMARAMVDEYNAALDKWRNSATSNMVPTLPITDAMRESVIHEGFPMFSPRGGDLFGEWSVKLNTAANVIRGYRGGGVARAKDVTSDITGTEGNGVYIARDRDFASQFGNSREVLFRVPQNPLNVGDETLYILSESDELFDPPKAGDSEWLAINKEAVRRSGITDMTWGEMLPKLNQTLTDILKERGYDAVYVDQGSDQAFVVLLDDSLLNVEGGITPSRRTGYERTGQAEGTGAAAAGRRGLPRYSDTTAGRRGQDVGHGAGRDVRADVGAEGGQAAGGGRRAVEGGVGRSGEPLSDGYVLSGGRQVPSDQGGAGTRGQAALPETKPVDFDQILSRFGRENPEYAASVSFDSDFAASDKFAGFKRIADLFGVRIIPIRTGKFKAVHIASSDVVLIRDHRSTTGTVLHEIFHVLNHREKLEGRRGNAHALRDLIDPEKVRTIRADEFDLAFIWNDDVVAEEGAGYAIEGIRGFTLEAIVKDGKLDEATALVNRLKESSRTGSPAMFSPSESTPAVTPEMDKAYLDAVEKGDLETAQRMVDEAAKRAGYTVGPVWHGTATNKRGKFPFTEFKTRELGGLSREAGETDVGSFFTADEAYARGVGIYKSSWRREGKHAIHKAFYLSNPDVIVRGARGQHTEYRATAPSQIKSADAVTRDDQGRVIPLSERFNEKSPDIRYSPNEPARDARIADAKRLVADAEARIQAMRSAGAEPSAADIAAIEAAKARIAAFEKGNEAVKAVPPAIKSMGKDASELMGMAHEAGEARAALADVLNSTDSGKTARMVADGRGNIRNAVNRMADAVARGEQARLLSVKKDIIAIIKARIPLENQGKMLHRIAGARTAADLEKAAILVDDYADEIERKNLVEVVKSLNDKIMESKSLSVEYVAMAKDVLAGIETGKPSKSQVAKLDALRELVRQADEAGVQVSIPRYWLDMLARMNDHRLDQMDSDTLMALAGQLAVIADAGKRQFATNEALWEQRKDEALKRLEAGTKPVSSAGRGPISPDDIDSIATAFKDQWDHAKTLGERWRLWNAPANVVFDMLDGTAGYKGANYQEFFAAFNPAWNGYLGEKHRLFDEMHEVLKENGIKRKQAIRVGMYAIARQERPKDPMYGRKKIYNVFGAVTDEQRAEVDSKVNAIRLTPEEQRFYDWMNAKLDAMWPRINDYTKRVWNFEIEKNDFYFPLITDYSIDENAPLYGTKIVDVDAETGMPVAEKVSDRPTKTVMQAFTEERTGAGKQKVQLDAVKVLMKHFDDALYAVHMGEQIKFAQEVASSERYRMAAGNIGQQFVQEYLSRLARKGSTGAQHTIRLLDILRKNMGIGSLGFNPLTVVVQFSSLIDGFGMIGAGWGSKGVMDAFTNEGRSFVNSHMPEIIDRLGGDWSFAETGRLGRLSYRGIAKADEITAVSVALGAYAKNLHDRGLEVDYSKPDQQAIDYAQHVVARTQASGSSRYTPLAVTKYGSISKAVYQFQTFPINKFWFMMHDGIGQAKSDNNWYRAFLLLLWAQAAFLAEQGVRVAYGNILDRLAGGGGDDDDEMAKKLAGRILWDNLQSVPILGMVSRSARYGSTPIPVLSTPEQLGKGLSSAVSGSTPAKQARGLIMTAGAAGQMAGLPASASGSRIGSKFVKDDSERLSELITDSAKRLPRTASAGRVSLEAQRAYNIAKARGLVLPSTTPAQFRSRYKSAFKRINEP